jgi:hypothetical protein
LQGKRGINYLFLSFLVFSNLSRSREIWFSFENSCFSDHHECLPNHIVRIKSSSHSRSVLPMVSRSVFLCLSSNLLRSGVMRAIDIKQRLFYIKNTLYCKWSQVASYRLYILVNCALFLEIKHSNI